MAQNLTQPSPYEDEIDLKEIFKILIESKKLIISTILIFTIASIIYSFSLKPSFKTSTKLEVGYLMQDNGDIKLVESISDLMSHLNILRIKNPDNKFNQYVVMNSIEGRIISLETSSSSAAQNENLLNEMISYINERHSRLEKLWAEQNKNEISFNIETTKAQINHYSTKLSSKYQSQYLDIISNLGKEDQAIENLKLLAKRSASVDKLFSLNQQLEISIQNLEKLESLVYSKTQRIGNIRTSTIKPKTQLIILLGLIIGFITGIFLVFIRNFVKSYKESEA